MASVSDTAPNKERIVPLPVVPPEIKMAVDRNNLVVFIGAGVSKIMGCKTWAELADQLLSECFSEGCINYKESQRLLSENSLKKKISLCKYILDKQKPNLFSEKVAKLLQSDANRALMFPIYQELYKLRAIYVTSNVDTNFDDMYFKDLIKYRPEDFAISTFSRTNLFHLHGTIRQDSSMILTVRNYVDFYTDDRVKDFLSKLFSNYSVLFVGYGMDELEILEYLFEKVSSRKEKRHFILLPMFRGEENILAFEESYYGDLGINVIPYSIDEKGYDQLFFVIQNFQKEINLSSAFLHDSFLDIEKNIGQYDAERAKRLLQLIKNDIPLENHFFKKLASADWLIPLKEAGYFNPNRNPQPSAPDKDGFYSIPFWNVLEYLTKVSLHPKDSNDKDHSQELLEIVRCIANYSQSGNRINNSTTDRVLLTIMANLPTSLLTIDDIDLIRFFFHSGWNLIPVSSTIEEKLLPNLIRNGETEKYLRLVDVILSFTFQEYPFGGRVSSILGDYQFSHIIDNDKVDMQSFHPLDTTKIVIKRVDEITKVSSTFGLRKMDIFAEKTPDFMRNEFEFELSRFAKGLLVSAIANEPLPTKELIKELLQKDHSFYKRLALSVTNSCWETASEIFLSWLNRPAITNYEIDRELRLILQTHYHSLSSEVKDRILAWIEEGPDWAIKQQDEFSFQQDTAYWKQDWAFIFKQFGYQKAIDAYNKYKIITGRDIQETHDDLEPATIEFSDRSPIKLEELAEKTDKELIVFLNEFKSSENGFLTPTKEGLANTLSDLISSDPKRFQENLDLFKNVELVYQEGIIGGFTKAQKGNKKINSSIVLTFCKAIFYSEGFWDLAQEESARRSAFIRQIADLITSGTKDDTKAFPEVDFQIIKDILLFLLEKTKTDLNYPNDTAMSTLNSTKGQVIAALMEYVLHIARLTQNEKETNVYWSPAIKTEFTRRLDRTVEPSLEWSFCLGEYLPNLNFLDKDWVKDNIDKIFLKGNEEHWLATLEGYLTTNVYLEIYDLVKSRNHIKKAILTNLSKDLRERLVDQICIAYLRERESLSDNNSLVRGVIDSWKHEDLINMVMFFWMQREYILDKTHGEQAEKEKLKTRILDFCVFVGSAIAKRSDTTQTQQQILSRLSLLACYVDEIDENTMKWLLLTANSADEYDRFFIEYLDSICDKSPHEVGLIFLKLSDSLVTFTQETTIYSIISKLYKTEKEVANQICNKYFIRGLEFARDLYEANKT